MIKAAIIASEAYVCLKGIKKKKMDKVEKFKIQFKEGFSQYLIEQENATPEEAGNIVENIWQIIEASASYLFNASHSLCVCCDSLYVAWLKAYYPYELYVTMLEIFDEKKNLDKISAIIDEMKRYKHIQLLSGRWGQDNRTWTVDKEQNIISQSLSSIKYMSKAVAEDLYNLSQQSEVYIGSVYTKDEFKPEVKKQIAALKKKLKPIQEKGKRYLEEHGKTDTEEFNQMYEEGIRLENEIKQILQDDNSYISRATEIKKYAKLNCFTNLLRAMQVNTCLDTRQTKILIGLDYFAPFGKPEKLMKVCDYFLSSKDKLTKTIVSFEERMEHCRAYEASLENTDIKPGLRLLYEYDNLGLCIHTDSTLSGKLYFVTEYDDKYSIKMKLYSVKRGASGYVKIAKKNYKENQPLGVGCMVYIWKFQKRPKYTYNKGERTVVPDEYEVWVTDYTSIPKENIA